MILTRLCTPFSSLYGITRIICDITLRSSAKCESVVWPVMGSNFLRALVKRVEMSSGRMVCLKWWPPWTVGTAAGDAIH